MPAQQEKVCLIVPCYNEEKRLDFTRFKSCGFIHYLFVNDGSTDGTAGLLASSVKEPDFWLDLPANCGKAEAVRRGMLFSRELPVWNELTWVGFWDADLATPVEEVEYFLKSLQFYGPVDAICGSRVDRLGSKISRDYFRHLLGRIFATVVQFLFHTGSYDSQCGAKLFRKEVIEQAFGEPFTSRWLFDIEILLRLAGRQVIECPLRRWDEIGGSKIRFFSFTWRALRDLYRMRKRYRGRP
ncbi:MAG TPA: glycosyltransferase [Candidatus Glassbacteria bacterium]|nr:glycosyltransferase [Candidatus Glassbacteria bacterium]